MKYSKLGYKRYSPDLYKKYNVIPSGRITMQDVDFPVYGVDDLGNEQMMYPGGEYQFPGNQVFEIPMFQEAGQFNENVRQRLVNRANEIIANKDFYRLSPEKAQIVKDNNGNPNELTCIGGVCRVLKDVGLMQDVIESNTDFTSSASNLGFSKPSFNVNALRPGDIIQHFGKANKSGKGYPTHAQMYLGKDENGNHLFFDNYRGTSQWFGKTGKKSYSDKELHKFLKKGQSGLSGGAQLIHINPNAVIDYETAEERTARENRENLRSRRLPVESYKDQLYSGSEYFDEVVNTQDLPYAYRYSEDASKKEKELISLFNNPDFDKKLRENFKVSDQTLETLKPIIYGIMKQESNFGSPETIGRGLKYSLENLIGPDSWSTGPAAVRYKNLRQPAKDLLEGNKNALETIEGAYIGALDSLLSSGNISDAYLSNNPELLDKDPWAAALYFYNGQGQSLKRGKTKFGERLRVDEGSYPQKVLENAQSLKRVIPFDSDLSNPDVYQNPFEVLVTPVQYQQGGQMSASAGYDSWYNSPVAAGRYTFNPKDPSEYYAEAYGTKQGPGIAAGMDYTNPKYRTQAMLRAGLDPEIGASLRAQGGYRFNPIDNRREQLAWGPYGGVRFQTEDYQQGVSNQLGINNLESNLTYGLNALYTKELPNRGRFSVEGDLGMAMGQRPEGNLGEGFDPRFYGSVKATYSPPMYKNTRNKKPGPTTYSSGYQQGGEQIKVRSGNTFDDYITNPLITAVVNGADAAGDWLNSTLESATSSALNAMYTSPTMGPIAIQMQGAARPWLAQNIRPVAYPGIFTGVTELTKGALGLNPPPARDAQGDYAVDEEAWRKALGLQTDAKYIVPSNYKPSKAKDPNAQYYTLNRDVIDPQLLIAEAKRRNLQEGQSAVVPSLAPYMREGFMPRDEFSQVDPLQNFTIGVGKDKKGNYVSIYDKYDFEGPLNSLTTPYEFYDRYYYAQGGQHGGLDRWFAEKWVDVKTGKECGRQAGEKRKGYPACRPSKRVSSDTPKTASELSSAEKAKFKREKTSSKRIDYNHKRKEYGGSIPRFRKDMY